eukprot:g76157.t1
MVWKVRKTFQSRGLFPSPYCFSKLTDVRQTKFPPSDSPKIVGGNGADTLRQSKGTKTLANGRPWWIFSTNRQHMTMADSSWYN